MSEWLTLDRQMHTWGPRLRDDLGLAPTEASSPASSIAREVGQLNSLARAAIRSASPIPIGSRIEELIAFQAWMDVAARAANPAVTRAQVITQNYVCFVYLRETWFEVLKQHLPSGSVTAKCCAFLLSDQVRRFRNGFSHGNWRYLPDFSGLEFWARDKGSGTKEVRSEVRQLDLSFWQTISRCTAYASMQTLVNTAA